MSDSTSSPLAERLRQELNRARKEQDRARTLLLGTILSDVRNLEIDQRRSASDDDVMDVVRRGIKRRRESAEMYDSGGRDELAARERSEVTVLETFLPAQVSDDELRAAIREVIAAGATNIGAVMGKVLPRFKGRADGSRVSGIAREELAG